MFFHNLRGYDSHLIMQVISGMKGNLSCIANNMEKYISFSLGRQIRFLDSLQFLNASLDKLVKSNDSFPITFKYEYMNNFYRFKETSLSRKKAFYSSLNDENITDEEYQHALKVWEKFNCKHFGDYYDLYVRTDVLLLADVFENFRKTCLKQYGLDPAHYYTGPGLSWDALLKHSKVQLELLTDYDMHLFIEKGMREGRRR